ncbi:kinase-like domain-containing protein [Roridomyces roridus]|uniref:Kinase-like domain-containing protein n=1 Tax=Roridomyces roridus TaxID=1738132 RepID=A0AAD7FN02_9AGAR|nr:kinase-like domain-containing protein [Roridomyces roridus]
MEKLDKLFHEDKEWYTKFLACRGAAAQRLLDLLQELLDYDTSSALIDRHRLFKALLRLSDHSKLYPTCFPLPALQHETLVAGGSFSDVYSGYLQNQCVGVKMMRVFAESDVEVVLKGFGREALIWRQLSHPNLLPFYGLYKFRQRLCLVSPWMHNGTIRAFLKSSPHGIEGLLSFILDMALGLEHLHAKGVVHGDLKGDNIFVTPSRKACIGDFGLSSIITSMSSVQFTHSSRNTQCGTARYQAPELYPAGQNDRRSDIYSFACVAYELLTGMAPFSNLTRDLAVIMAVREGHRPARPPSCTGTPALDALWRLLQDCWQGEPQSRPTASQVVERLEGGDIRASETRGGPDWDRALTSKFRRQLIGQLALPSVVELERILFV